MYRNQFGGSFQRDLKERSTTGQQEHHVTITLCSGAMCPHESQTHMACSMTQLHSGSKSRVQDEAKQVHKLYEWQIAHVYDLPGYGSFCLINYS